MTNRRPTIQAIADMGMIALFVLGIGLPAAGLVRPSQSDEQSAEQRLAAAWPVTDVGTIYQRSWRRGVDAFVDDRFGLRQMFVAFNNYLAVTLLHSSPKLAPAAIPPNQVAQTTTPQGIATDPSPPAPQPPTDRPPTEQLQPAPNTESLRKSTVAAWKEADVVVGQDGWLFLDQEGAIDDYRCYDPFEPGELDRIAANIEELRAHLEQQGIAFYLLIAPDKTSIYPEYLPKSVSRVGQVCRIDQAVATIKKRTRVTMIDTRHRLLERKAEVRVFQKTDTHWNDVGAFVAYHELLSAIHQRFPSVQPYDRSEFEQRTKTVPGLDLARLLSLQQTMKEQDITLTPLQPRQAVQSTYTFADPNPGRYKDPAAWEVPGSTAPRLLLLRDSFARAPLPFIIEHFSRTASVWSYAALPDILQAEQPDIVVMEVVQRKLEEALMATDLIGQE